MGSPRKCLRNGKELNMFTSECNTEETSKPVSNIRHKLFLFFLLSEHLLVGLCYSQLATFFPTQAKKKGVSSTMSGWIFALPALTRVVTTPILGYFITVIGVRFMAISGLLIYGVSVLLFGFLIYSPDGWIFTTMCLISRGFEGIGWGAFSVARYVLVTEKCPDNVGQINAIAYCIRSAGQSLGPPIGGALFEYLGFVYSFGILGSLLIVDILISAPFIPSIQGTPKEKTSSKLMFLKYLKTWIGFFTAFVSCAIYVFIEPILEPHLRRINLGTVTIGFMFLLNSTITTISLLISGWISDRKPWQGQLILISAIMACVGYLTIGPAPFLPFLPFNVYTVVVSLIILGIGMGGMYAPCIVFLLRAAREIGMPENVETYGVVSVVMNTAIGLGMFVGPFSAGALLDILGFEWSFCIPALILLLNIFAIIGTLISDRINRSERSNEPQNYMSLEIRHDTT